MTIDSRGRRAGQDFRRAIDDLGSSAPDRGSIARFERVRVRKQRNRRIGATLLATGVTVAAIVFVGRVFGPVGRGTPAAPNLPGGLILYGDWDAQGQRADWYTARPDGSGLRDLRSARRARSGSRTGTGSWSRTTQPRGRQAAPSGGGRCRRVEPPSARCGDEPGAEPRVRRRVARRDADRARGVRRGRRPRAGRDLLRPGLGRRGARPTPSRAGLAPEVLTGRHSLELLRHQGRRQPHGVGSAVRDAGRRQRPASHHAVGLRLRRPRVVARRSVDRVPEAVRTALSGAPRWLGAPPGPAPAPSGSGR